MRRQLSLFLPEPERSLVDRVRSKYDPAQFRRIPAHVTLCREHEVRDRELLKNRLEGIRGMRIAFALGEPKRLADGCILVPVVDQGNGFDKLRRALLGESYAQMIPHITLVHPASGVDSRRVIDELRSEGLPGSCFLTTVSLIEQEGAGDWEVDSSYDIWQGRWV